MKKSFYNKLSLFTILSLISIFAFAKQEKIVQIFRDGEIIQEYSVDEIDYIEVNDRISAPGGINASVSDNHITIKWNAVEGATYNVYRSPDNINFVTLASNLTATSYTDTKPLQGSNFYKVKAIVGGVESGYTASVSASLTGTNLESGIYLGITGFNQSIYKYPVAHLNEGSISGFRNFVDGLTMKNGTLLYYSFDEALKTMQSTSLPSDISTAAIVTFTDGLDQGSMMKDDVTYENDLEYLNALNNRIKTETIAGKPIKAFSIGIRGKDVADIDMFRDNLAKLASSEENATEVTSMAEVNAKFKEIAEQLSQSNYIQTINLKMPGVSNGTIVRFTFDNVKSAQNSQLYIEGTFNLKQRSLENVKYVGLTSTSGSTIKGTVEDIFVNFTFEGIQTTNNVLIKSEFTDEWTYIASNSSWQINSEFDKTENSDIVTKRSSAVIMLVLDCSSSLANDFVKAQNNAKDFINTLYNTVSGGNENPGESSETIYSTTPADLTVAIWKDGKRYFLTPEQYKNANLTKARVEGLTVLSNLGSFIISPDLIVSNPVNNKSAMSYYSNVLPNKNQATVISARYIDINKALDKLEWPGFLTSDTNYLTNASYDYDSEKNYTINLYSYVGGSLGASNRGYIRGITSLPNTGPLIWKEDVDLYLSVIKDGKRYFIPNTPSDPSQYDEIEGVLLTAGTKAFIVKLNDAQTGNITISAAVSLYNDILPDYSQAEIISMKCSEINGALLKYGGTSFETNSSDVSYLTKTPHPYNSDYNYTIRLYKFNGGSLGAGNSGRVRGVKNL